MAEVTKVVLDEVTLVPRTDDVQVRVEYEIRFLEEEIGQTFEVKVELVESDIAPDEELQFIGSDPDLLYTFKPNTSGPFMLFNTLKGKVVVKPGELVHTKTLTAKVDRALLDEDPGETDFASPKFPIPGGKLPHPDEISARVSVTHQKISAQQHVPELK